MYIHGWSVGDGLLDNNGSHKWIIVRIWTIDQNELNGSLDT